MELIVFLVLAVVVGGLIYGSIRKTGWGINFSRVSCPKCRTRAPFFRKPASGSQAMWGGYTCPNCGTQMDKWGRELPAPPRSPA